MTSATSAVNQGYSCSATARTATAQPTPHASACKAHPPTNGCATRAAVLACTATIVSPPAPTCPNSEVAVKDWLGPQPCPLDTLPRAIATQPPPWRPKTAAAAPPRAERSCADPQCTLRCPEGTVPTNKSHVPCGTVLARCSPRRPKVLADQRAGSGLGCGRARNRPYGAGAP